MSARVGGGVWSRDDITCVPQQACLQKLYFSPFCACFPLSSTPHALPSHAGNTINLTHACIIFLRLRTLFSGAQVILDVSSFSAVFVLTSIHSVVRALLICTRVWVWLASSWFFLAMNFRTSARFLGVGFGLALTPLFTTPHPISFISRRRRPSSSKHHHHCAHAIPLRGGVYSPLSVFVPPYPLLFLSTFAPPGRSTAHPSARPTTQPITYPPNLPPAIPCAARRSTSALCAAGAAPAHNVPRGAWAGARATTMLSVFPYFPTRHLKRQHNCTIFPIQANATPTPIRRLASIFFLSVFRITSTSHCIQFLV